MGGRWRGLMILASSQLYFYMYCYILRHILCHLALRFDLLRLTYLAHHAQKILLAPPGVSTSSGM